MSSAERREVRYWRRKFKRDLKKLQRSNQVGPIQRVFSFRHMYDYGKMCCKGVRWKQSAQNFELNLVSGSAERRRKVILGTYKNRNYVHFVLNERGKTREIDAPHIEDRQVHKVMGNEVLLPLYTPSMINDNGASLKGKGLHWQFKRVRQHIAWHYRRYKREGGILLIDLKGFFPNAPIDQVIKRHDQFVLNPEIKREMDRVVYSSPLIHTGKGMPIGVEISQQEMIALPSAIDNWLKCQKSLHCMGHYMDDYYVMHPDLDYLEQLRDETIDRFEAMGIQVNRAKCKIIPFTKPFKFCKAKFTIRESGKIIVNGNPGGMKRIRRKLKKFDREYQAGTRTLDSIWQTVQSQRAYYDNYNDHEKVLQINRMYHAMFIKPYQTQQA